MNNTQNQLQEYKNTISTYEEQLNLALQEINTITFSDSEQGVKDYKSNIAQARKLSKNIDTFRKNYKNYYLSLIESDLNTLKGWTDILDNEISNVSHDYDNWYADLKINRMNRAKGLYQEILPDYFNNLSLEYSDIIWHNIIQPKTFAKAMTDNKITDYINDKLQYFATDLRFITNKELFFECNLDKEQYLKEICLIEKYSQQEQNLTSEHEQELEKSELINPDTSIETTTITINVADLPIVMKLLKEHDIKFIF